MAQDQISELEQRIAQSEKQVGQLEEVVTQSEDVKAVGLGRGAEQAISILARCWQPTMDEVADGFDRDEFLRRLQTSQRSTAGEAQGTTGEGAVPRMAGRQGQGADLRRETTGDPA